VLSLRVFHLFFLLVAIVGADLVGIWAINRYYRTDGTGMLVMGLICLVGGLGLLVYGIWFVRKMDRVHIQ